MSNEFQPQVYDSKNTWIQTWAGVEFPVLNPKPEHVWITDISHALSNICRFGGHVNKFYSVAQHSIIVSENVPAEFAFEGLMHDATEAYIGDLVRPLKHCGLLDDFHEIEAVVWGAIAEKFSLLKELPSCIHEADARVLMTEKRDLKSKRTGGTPWAVKAEPYDFTIHALPPEEAERRFAARFNKLWRERTNVRNAA